MARKLIVGPEIFVDVKHPDGKWEIFGTHKTKD
jgi:hypothetical protein